MKVITWLQTAWKSASTETIKQCFQKCGFDIGHISIINEEIDTEFQESFPQISSETTLDQYIDFDAETVTLEPAVDPIHVDCRQKCHEKSIAEVLQSEDTVLINDLDDGITDDQKR